MTAAEATQSRTSVNTLPIVLRTGGELVGSFLICLGIYLFSTIGLTLYGPSYLPFIAIATGLIYAAVTMMLGGVCGCQFNPAITVAAMLVSKTRVLEGVLAIVAQVLGGVAAGAVTMKVMLPTSDAVTVDQWMLYVNNGFDDGSLLYGQLNQSGVSFGIAAIIIEVVAGLVIVGTAMRMTDDRGVPRPGYALAMGVAYGACAAVATPVTGAALNPVRSTGIAVFSAAENLTQNPLDQLWVFWICPVLAAALVALPMIVVQMMRGSQTSRIEIVDADDRSDAGTESESESETSVEDVTDADAADADEDASDEDASDADDVRESADEHADAEVGDQQADAQGDADEGVESH